MNSRIGFGYDVHSLIEGRKLILGGVEIPFEKGLLGHSDADVLLHAISDALLGAAALGDIGLHFPDTDEQYKGMNSLTMLSHVGTLLDKNGYSIGNIDSTLILERPKIAPHIQKMIENISLALHIHPNLVSIKATTNEKLGFVGRGEGAAAQAVTLIHSINK
ncbi:MAG: 2-C-methyl-D-erythritol 2,4-cyclodiphosphate synthase [Bacteroidota bacterium]|jgi:2-C-methyl-D-erythritol 2,4-cyclodiphosphate synthase